MDETIDKIVVNILFFLLGRLSETSIHGLPCLVQLLTWLHVSDFRSFWNTEIW